MEEVKQEKVYTQQEVDKITKKYLWFFLWWVVTGFGFSITAIFYWDLSLYFRPLGPEDDLSVPIWIIFCVVGLALAVFSFHKMSRIAISKEEMQAIKQAKKKGVTAGVEKCSVCGGFFDADKECPSCGKRA